MGWFGKRASAKALEQEETEARGQVEAEAADPNAALKRQFAAAVTRGDLDNASDVLNRYLAENVDGLEDYREGMSLLEHAALARRALNEGQLDKMADLLLGWEIKPPNTSTMGPERMAQLPNLNALGMSLIDFFNHATPESEPRYDKLLSEQLRHVAQWTRLSSPRPQAGGFFDRVYADIQSKREMSRITEDA